MTIIVGFLYVISGTAKPFYVPASPNAWVGENYSLPIPPITASSRHIRWRNRGGDWTFIFMRRGSHLSSSMHHLSIGISGFVFKL
ncbi:uncharacterized protein HD556DRAFT_1413805, partial [Suillus plorans]